MKKVINIVILIVFWGIPFAILYIIFKKVGVEATNVIVALYLTLLFTSIAYKHFWSFQTFNKKEGIIEFLSLVVISFLVILYSNSLVFRAYHLYKYLVAENKRGWKGNPHQTDDTLGFKPIPNARAFHIFPIGDEIPMAYDKNGFRVPIFDTSKINESNKTNLLFLGCSFTYGDACIAEETFPFLVAKEANLSYINAGVCGYGLSHMLLLAERLIPNYKPDYVVLQFSPWLVRRSISFYAPVYFGSVPTPYFSVKQDNYDLELPVYQSQVFNLDAEQIKNSYQKDLIKFLFEKGVLFYLYEDWHYQKTKILVNIGYINRPATNLIEVEKYAYNRIKTIADENGAVVIILNLGSIEYSKKSHSLFSDSNIYFAEADSSLNEILKNSLSKDYNKEFGHWRFDGKDTIYVDGHPNFKSHSLIARSIMNVIDKTNNK